MISKYSEQDSAWELITIKTLLFHSFQIIGFLDPDKRLVDTPQDLLVQKKATKPYEFKIQFFRKHSEHSLSVSITKMSIKEKTNKQLLKRTK